MPGRVAAVAAVSIAVVVVAVIVLCGGSGYQVAAIFPDASQIVNGDQVEVAGNSVGSISNIALTRSGQAQITFSVSNSNYTPLHQGTQATVRPRACPESPTATSTCGSDRPPRPRSRRAA